jgi:hypothetical protein
MKQIKYLLDKDGTITQKKCIKCGEFKDIFEFDQNHQRKNNLSVYCKTCKHKEYLKNLQRNLNRTKKYNDKLKERAYEILSNGKIPSCTMHEKYNCCGNPYDKDYLSIDHIDGSGAKQKREFKSSSSHSVYRWIINNPEIAKKILRIVCMNFNVKKKIFNKETNWRIPGITYIRRGKAGRPSEFKEDRQ